MPRPAEHQKSLQEDGLYGHESGLGGQGFWGGDVAWVLKGSCLLKGGDSEARLVALLLK